MYNVRPKFIMLIGIPGCGKTSYCKTYKAENPNTIHLSSDEIRMAVTNNSPKYTKEENNFVFKYMSNEALKELNNGNNVLYDATNLTRKSRKGILERLPKYCEVNAIIFTPTIEECIERDNQRESLAKVGADIIDKMVRRFQIPYFDEGFDRIDVINNGLIESAAASTDSYNSAVTNMKINHDNKHHRLSIYDHCIEAANYAMDKNFNTVVCRAAMYHDIGKPYCKTFVNKKSEVSKEAHYYDHQNVGAYIYLSKIFIHDYVMSISTVDKRLFIGWLINNHMELYNNSKYIKSLPDFMRIPLEQLHECDIKAH